VLGFFVLDGVDGDAAAVVGDAARAVGVDGDLHEGRVPGHRFVDGVVDRFVDEVVERVETRAADVHARALADGFEPFEDTRHRFDVRFYLVAILFIIFDLEVAFLFPWVFQVAAHNVFAFWSMMSFLGVLTIGFIYEWRRGALEWE
jgi:NADH-quinone oxidoreductase subunit A